MNKITRFRDITHLTKYGSSHINVELRDVPHMIETWQEDEYYKLKFNPDFQRGYVWTEDQQVAYVESLLRGGKPARTIYFNKPSWQSEIAETDYDDFVYVDGLQRITAVLKFINNEIKIFGSYYKEFEDSIPSNIGLMFSVNNLQTEKEVLKWYIDMNTGGTKHKMRK